MDRLLMRVLDSTDPASWPDAELIEGLIGCHEDVISKAVFTDPGDAIDAIVGERISLMRSIRPAFDAMVREGGVEFLRLADLWTVHLPLAQYLVRRRSAAGGCYTVLVVGGPGSGKTTLARVLALALEKGFGARAVAFSSDDFFLDRKVRRERGFSWRGPPGTYDDGALSDVFANIRTQGRIPRLPRFDTGRDERRCIESVPGPLSFCIFEGWTAFRLLDNLSGPGGGAADLSIYLDTELDFLRGARLEKEAVIRARSNGEEGLSETDMKAFWNEVIEPGLGEYVTPYRDRADLVLTIGNGHRVMGALRA